MCRIMRSESDWFDARLQNSRGMRLPKAIGDLEALDRGAQRPLALRRCLVGNDDHEVHIGNTRKPATRRTAEKDHADERLLDLCANP